MQKPILKIFKNICIEKIYNPHILRNVATPDL
ncbi:hypothetical protein Murru_0562 [Allomuricauda ruestringensis DSM 13258]|uniref:Uncharacterized protein n=1 Tax=Allomuricauda ruestringensis (strain DSM 13258 / CIP 107369 / LMG 19739 / B1) TaxID=886377 RepID=G2PS23_ALLRU|nr:hypothetical protein Murru_0562 [Allomuricauda ruestringensis DSM 13258]